MHRTGCTHHSLKTVPSCLPLPGADENQLHQRVKILKMLQKRNKKERKRKEIIIIIIIIIGKSTADETSHAKQNAGEKMCESYAEPKGRQ